MGNRRSIATQPATEYRITRVLTVNTRNGETCRVPELLFTVRDLQAMVDNRELSGTVDLICERCGDSVADCIELASQLTGVPFEWSWQSKVEQD